VLAFVANMLVALLAEFHARSVWNVDALAASVVGAAAVSVPPILLTLVTTQGFCQAQLSTAHATLEHLSAFLEHLLAIFARNHDQT